MTNHLVVGIHGTIGSALFARLQKDGTDVWGTTHRPPPYPENVFYLNLMDQHNWEFTRPFDVAYLCAGVCRMALCEADPTNTRQVNIEGITALARRLADTGAFIVYLSTNQVFSGNTPFALPNSPHDPLNEYGKQKAKAEARIQTVCKQWAIVRLTKVIEHQLEKMPLFKTWIDRLQQHQTIEAFNDMMLAPVTLNQVIKVIKEVGKKKQTGCFQVSGREDISYYDFARYLAKSLKRPLSLVEAVSALDKGIKKSFLPKFTTLNCLSTISLCGEKPPHYSEIVQECFL